jgi:CheY-like chemotaxis protein
MKPYRDQTLHLLLVEDQDADVTLFQALMAGQTRPAFTSHRVATLRDALAYLLDHAADVILLDLNLPDCRGLRTFDRLHAATRTPIVVLSGLDDEETAIEAVHKGAQDYLVKWECDRKQLARALVYAVERHHLLAELAEAHEEIKSLRSLIPICSYCRRVRHDDGYWQHLESYLAATSRMDFSHGICPDCYARLEVDPPCGKPPA